MNDQLVVALTVAVVLVLLATVAVWIGPLLRRGSGRAETNGPDRTPHTATAPLAQGFGYLFAPLGLSRRERSLGLRLERALERIGSVDPYASPRRIGQILQAPAGAEPDPGTDPEEPGLPRWPFYPGHEPSTRD